MRTTSTRSSCDDCTRATLSKMPELAEIFLMSNLINSASKGKPPASSESVVNMIPLLSNTASSLGLQRPPLHAALVLAGGAASRQAAHHPATLPSALPATFCLPRQGDEALHLASIFIHNSSRRTRCHPLLLVLQQQHLHVVHPDLALPLWHVRALGLSSHQSRHGQTRAL